MISGSGLLAGLRWVILQHRMVLTRVTWWCSAGSWSGLEGQGGFPASGTLVQMAGRLGLAVPLHLHVMSRCLCRSRVGLLTRAQGSKSKCSKHWEMEADSFLRSGLRTWFKVMPALSLNQASTDSERGTGSTY